MKKIIVCLFWTVASALYAQKPSFTANDVITPYNGTFAYGTNPGYYGGFNNNSPNDKLLADLMENAGLHTLRPKLYEAFTTQWGLNVRKSEFQYYTGQKGMHDIALFVTNGISEANWSTDNVNCSGKNYRSQVFKNMYLPIWDNNNGTAINEDNHYAYFIYQVMQTYGDYIKFLEVWNEPDFTYNSGVAIKTKGQAGNWYENDPNPCDLPNLYAKVPQYVRLMRISYEVVKATKPAVYITTGGIGYESFLDAMMRMTDNPDGGKVTNEYPLKAGAYFDVLSYHSYPQYSLTKWNNAKGDFDYFRYSDYAVQKIWELKSKLYAVLRDYGYDGKVYPQKHWIITECNIPRKFFDDGKWIGSNEAQRNFIVKAFVQAQQNDVQQFYTFTLGDTKDESAAVASGQGMDLMGMYYNLNKATPSTAVLTPTGVATKTLTSLIYGYEYDVTTTAALKLPSTADGAAFSKNGTTYCVLWAKTNTDRSETATSAWTLPGTLLPGATIYPWDYSSTGITLNVPPTTTVIELSGTPIVLKADFLSVNPTGLQEDLLVGSLKVFPNPAKGTITIHKLNLGKSLQLEIQDLNGRLLCTQQLNDQLFQTLDISAFASGLYYMKFTNGERSRVEKLIVE